MSNIKIQPIFFDSTTTLSASWTTPPMQMSYPPPPSSYPPSYMGSKPKFKLGEQDKVVIDPNQVMVCASCGARNGESRCCTLFSVKANKTKLKVRDNLVIKAIASH